MAKVKRGLSGLSVPLLLVKSLHIQESMNGNVNFPTPDPPLTDIAAKTDALTAATQAAESGDHALVALKKQLRRELIALLNRLGTYVELTSKGDEQQILSSGFDVAGGNAPIGPVTAPAGLVAIVSAFIGSIDLDWKPVRGALTYLMQINAVDPDTEAEWKQLAVVSQSKFSAQGLQTGTVYWFRVAAIGAAGQGPFSDPARCVAP